MSTIMRMAAAVGIGLALSGHVAIAEVAKLSLAQQHGTAFIPMMIMQEYQLIEKHAEKAGLPKPQVNWVSLAGPMINDGLISGSLQYAAAGAPTLAILSDRTKRGVRGVGMICSYKLYLNTRNPNVKTIADFTQKDRIAVTSVKVAVNAIRLQMEAERIWGAGKHEQIDHLTVSLAHPEAAASLLNDRSEITAHFAASPFHEREIADSRIRTVLKADTAVYLLTTQKFHDDNPKTARAVFDALSEAIQMANADPKAAITLYKKKSGDKSPDEQLLAQTYNADFKFDLAPVDVGEITQFLNRIGTIKTSITSWKDLFFEDAWNLPGK